MRAICSSSTIKGNKGVNQDRFGIDDIFVSFDSPEIACDINMPLNDDIHVAVVADGVTNSVDGGKCAEHVVKTISDAYGSGYFAHEINKEKTDELMGMVTSLIRWDLKTKEGVSGATTVSLVCFSAKRIWCYNLGDSPIYLIRDGKLKMISEEHTMGAEKERENEERGVISKLFNKNIPSEREYNSLTKCVSSSAVELDGYFVSMEFLNDDILLIASDGLFKAVKEEEILHIINNEMSAYALIQKAQENYASDDVTVTLIRKDVEK